METHEDRDTNEGLSGDTPNGRPSDEAVKKKSKNSKKQPGDDAPPLRYPKRNIPRKNYAELEIPDEDSFIRKAICDVLLSCQILPSALDKNEYVMIDYSIFILPIFAMISSIFHDILKSSYFVLNNLFSKIEFFSLLLFISLIKMPILIWESYTTLHNYLSIKA